VPRHPDDHGPPGDAAGPPDEPEPAATARPPSGSPRVLTHPHPPRTRAPTDHPPRCAGSCVSARPAANGPAAEPARPAATRTTTSRTRSGRRAAATWARCAAGTTAPSSRGGRSSAPPTACAGPAPPAAPGSAPTSTRHPPQRHARPSRRRHAGDEHLSPLELEDLLWDLDPTDPRSTAPSRQPVPDDTSPTTTATTVLPRCSTTSPAGPRTRRPLGPGRIPRPADPRAARSGAAPRVDGRRHGGRTRASKYDEDSLARSAHPSVVASARGSRVVGRMCVPPPDQRSASAGARSRDRQHLPSAMRAPSGPLTIRRRRAQRAIPRTSS
jgi:hypothetical protein